MTDSAIELSNTAVAALFGSGGFLFALITNCFAKRKDGGSSKCLFHTDIVTKNDSEHKELFRRVNELEKGLASGAAKVDAINDRLDRIEDTLSEIRDHILKQ